MAAGASDAVPGLMGRLLEFSAALREAGVAIAVSDDLDATTALRHLDLLDRSHFREALSAILVKDPAGRRTFEELFELYFPLRPVRSLPAVGEEDADDPAAAERYLDALVGGLMDGDEATIRRLAREAVERFGRAQGRDGTDSWFQYRVFRAVDVAVLLERLLTARAAQSGHDPSPLEGRLWRDEFEARLRTFRQEVEAEVRRRYAEQRGPDRVARGLVHIPLEERDFFRLTAVEQAQLRAHIRPLARKLATRLAVKRRQGRDGRLDVRRTVRRSLATGGVPFDPAFRSRRPHKPELFLLCDVSGSVAAFARFTLMLVHTLQDQFSKVRSFAFVDTLDEVTGLFAAGDLADAVARMTASADVVWFDGHSDYGHSLEVFQRRYATEVTARTSVLVLGDARNNYRASGTWALEDVARRARRVYWLNPERRALWDTGDSVASAYAAHVHEMVEVRNLAQLSRFVQRVA